MFDASIRTDVDTAEAAGVREFRHHETDGGVTGLVDPHKLAEIHVAERIAVEYEDRVGGKLEERAPQGAAGAERFGFGGVVELQPAVTVAEAGADGVGTMAGAEHDVMEPVGVELIEEPCEHGPAADFGDDLRGLADDAAQAGAEAAGEDGDADFRRRPLVRSVA